MERSLSRYGNPPKKTNIPVRRIKGLPRINDVRQNFIEPA
jgi:hypothetical protein